MSEQPRPTDETVKAIAKRLPSPAVPVYEYLVRCAVVNVVNDRRDTFMDLIPGTNEEDAKDYLAGILSDHDLEITDFNFVKDLRNLTELARTLSR